MDGGWTAWNQPGLGARVAATLGSLVLGPPVRHRGSDCVEPAAGSTCAFLVVPLPLALALPLHHFNVEC